jgi:hypothetical protein
MTGELVVRLARSSRTVTRTAAFALGDAFIDAEAGSGVLATIYVDRVEEMAAMSEADAAILLGRVIAHELGHLLLATSAHSTTGLMRGYWTPSVIRRNQMTDWMLTRNEADAIKRRLEFINPATSAPRPSLPPRARR